MKQFLSNLLCICTFLFTTEALHSTNFIVSNTNDAGSGSLREAMTFCNLTPSPDSVLFNIAGMAPHTINLVSSLPALVDPSSVIAGNTQPGNGYTGSGPKIIIIGGGGITLTGLNMHLLGLSIRNSSAYGISIQSGASGFRIGRSGIGCVINGSAYGGIDINGADNGYIQGSYIGVNDAGTAPAPNNYYGITMGNSADGTHIGGSALGEGNVISGNRYHGLDISCSSNTVIWGNKIGTDVSGTISIPNEYSGINVDFGNSPYTCNAQANRIGGIGAGEGNIVANNLYYGINVCGTNVKYNPIRGNSVYCNSYSGISLVDGNYGQPNGNDSYGTPVISAASGAGANGTAPNNAIIDLYGDDNCSNCEPKTYIATTNANGTGLWNYSGSLSGSITVIATDPTNNNTSRNSVCILTAPVVAPSAGFSSGSQDICTGDCITFTDNSFGVPTIWTWTFQGGNPSTFSGQNPPQICYANPGSFTVSLYVSNSAGNNTSTQVGYITVSQSSTANAGNDTSICLGGVAQLSGTGGTSQVWDNPSTLSNPNIPNPLANPIQTTTYTLTTNPSLSCPGIDSVTVFVNPLPVIDAGMDDTICAGDTTTVSGSGGSIYSWSPSPLLLTPSQASSLAYPSVTTLIYLTGTDVNGCANSDSVRIVVNPLPIPVITQIGNTMHPGGTWVSYQWYFNGAPILGATDSTYTGVQAGQYTVHVTDINGCTGVSAAYDFSVVSSVKPEQKSLNIFPNPAKNTIRIQLNGYTEHGKEIQIRDVSGKLVFEKKVIPGEINIEGFSSGIYLVSILADGEMFFGKLMVE